MGLVALGFACLVGMALLPDGQVAGSDHCMCSYVPGKEGCKRGVGTPANHACQCTVEKGWCSGKLVQCKETDSPHCINSGTDYEHCKQGVYNRKGNCCGYDNADENCISKVQSIGSNTFGNPFTQQPLLGCVWNGASYQSGYVNEGSCLNMRCNDGVWEYESLNYKDCGRCTVEGDPHFLMFDNTTFLLPIANKYKFSGVGNFNITQHGLSNNPPFGVNAAFGICNTDHARGLSCVTSISYYEQGITIDVELPDQKTDKTFPICTDKDHTPSTDSNCQFKVKVNGIEKDVIARRTLLTQSTFGNVLIFIHNRIGGHDNLFCMNVVGSQGLSVSLCQHAENFSYLYVFPMPFLKGQLYGLCNTYTGIEQDYLTLSRVSGQGTKNTTEFGDSWEL